MLRKTTNDGDGDSVDLSRAEFFDHSGHRSPNQRMSFATPTDALSDIVVTENPLSEFVQIDYLANDALASPVHIQPVSVTNSNGSPVSSKRKCKPSLWSRLCSTHQAIYARQGYFLTMWIAAHVALFAWRFLYFATTQDYATIRSVLSFGLPIARAAAMCLNVDAAVILVFACKRFMALLRRVPVIKFLLPVDDRYGHILSAWTLVFFTAVHIGGHLFNAIKLRDALSVNPWIFLFASGPGWTGNGALLMLFVIVSTAALRQVRHKRFEVFHLAHYAFIGFYGFLVIHGAFCFIQADTEPKCRGFVFWRFAVGPLGLLFVELTLRFKHGSKQVPLMRAIEHPNNVMELQFAPKRLFNRGIWNFRPGQYVSIKCPTISRLQWHPFTITSSPEDDYMSVHVRLVGDWTRSVHQLLADHQDDKDMDLVSPKPTFYLDGPFGAPSESFFDYEVAVMVGAGIGVTPFASILKTISHRVSRPYGLGKIKKIYFFWICRDVAAFEWFQDLLATIEPLAPLIEIRCFLTTRKATLSMAHNVAINDDEVDAITRLQARTRYGRPRWAEWFERIQQAHRGQVGVFACGPQPLTSELERQCWRHSNSDTTFLFFKEVF